MAFLNILQYSCVFLLFFLHDSLSFQVYIAGLGNIFVNWQIAFDLTRGNANCSPIATS